MTNFRDNPPEKVKIITDLRKPKLWLSYVKQSFMEIWKLVHLDTPMIRIQQALRATFPEKSGWVMVPKSDEWRSNSNFPPSLTVLIPILKKGFPDINLATPPHYSWKRSHQVLILKRENNNSDFYFSPSFFNVQQPLIINFWIIRI